MKPLLILALLLVPTATTQANDDAPSLTIPVMVLQLEQALEDGARRDIFDASVGLAQAGPKAIAAERLLLEMLRSGDDFRMTMACAITQGIGSQAERLVDDLQPLLLNKNFHLQYWACRALCAIGPAAHETIPQLIDCLKNGKASVRHNAATALGSVTSPCHKGKYIVLAALKAALDDYSFMVREAAKAAIRNIMRNDT